eukprot:CAMPEP_0181370462 /NCGR_PEP_ID=MMETSP1106-20121128/13439_1 /TAXON_ID=81844 /ORGANISM="Mantoniella antarctica, Strain SL-175" /LENGTH=230 /DNA_ID=CAMNT_0023487257 /DNA_START=62 /DNA_END=754 /DNA_ORIENTATION=-
MFAVSANAACAAPAATASAARPRTGHATPARFHQKAAFVGAQVRMGRAAQSRRTAVQCRAAVGKDAAEVPGTNAKGLGKALPMAMDIDQIMALLPHRYPFLLVDRVVEIEQGSYAIGLKNVTINDNFFPGHFPQRPIMPGVLMIEAMAQVGGLIMLDPKAAGEGGTQQQFFFAGIDGVKFRRPVVPGDQLVMKVVLTKMNKRFGVAKMKGQCFVGEELACEAELTLAMGK